MYALIRTEHYSGLIQGHVEDVACPREFDGSGYLFRAYQLHIAIILTNPDRFFC